jgi:hypothetical protein
MIDQSLVVDMNDRALPQFAKTFDRALGGIIEKRMTFQLDELAGKDGNFGEVESVMPAVVPRLLKYVCLSQYSVRRSIQCCGRFWLSPRGSKFERQ